MSPAQQTQQTDNQPPWLSTLPPRRIFTICALCALIAVLGAALTLSLQPTIGGIWEPVPGQNNGLLLKNADHFPGFKGISEVIVMAIGHNDNIAPLHALTLISDPDQYATFAAFNASMAEQASLSALLHQTEVRLILETGDSVTVPVRPSRSIFSLPFTFWIYAGVGTLCFLISVGVWCYRRSVVSSRLLALSGFGFFISMLCLPLYALRELALAPILFELAVAMNHFFMILFCYALLLLFFFYPCKIGNRSVVIAISSSAVFIWLNQTFQWLEPPIHAYFLLNHIIPYIAAIILGIVQWRMTRRKPVERAVLRWFILSIWISIGGGGAMFIIPSLIGHYEAIPLWISSLGVLAMFIFFAFGTLRCGLFGLEKWWFTGWAWLLTGAIVILADLFIITLLNMKMQQLWPVSLLLLGWLYFPARYWLWNILERRDKNRIEETLPELLQALFSSNSQQDIIDKWPEMLRRIFQPLELTTLSSPSSTILVHEHGLSLEVPGVAGENGWLLKANHEGKKLFGPGDQKMAMMLHNLASAILNITNRIVDAREKGSDKERERIMRDLHDDVLPKLITLKHRSSPPLTETADAAFQSLRDCIYLLRNRVEKPVTDVLADWRAETAERLAPLPITLSWTQNHPASIPAMSSLQQINGGRILQEAVSNIIKHAGAQTVAVNISITENLTVTITDNGRGIPDLDQDTWQKVGSSNMRIRVQEMGGALHWRNLQSASSPSQPSGLMVSFSIPLTFAPLACTQ